MVNSNCVVQRGEANIHTTARIDFRRLVALCSRILKIKSAIFFYLYNDAFTLKYFLLDPTFDNIDERMNENE